jgi:hypothetical protein
MGDADRRVQALVHAAISLEPLVRDGGRHQGRRLEDVGLEPALQACAGQDGLLRRCRVADADRWLDAMSVINAQARRAGVKSMVFASARGVDGSDGVKRVMWRPVRCQHYSTPYAGKVRNHHFLARRRCLEIMNAHVLLKTLLTGSLPCVRRVGQCCGGLCV